MNQLAVRNWSEFQHYRDRTPVWIKLYLGLLDNYEFCQLSDGERGQLVMIWLLAAKTNGVIPDDPKWIAGRIQSRSKLRLDRFVALGFLERVAPTLLAETEQSATLEKRREEKEERREESTATTRDDFLAMVPPETRPDVEALLRSAHNPDAVLRSLEAVVSGLTPPAYDHATIGRAIQEMAATGGRFSVNGLRAFCRNLGREPASRTATTDNPELYRDAAA